MELLFPLGNYGVGARVTRTTWNVDAYWEITRLKYNKRAQREDGTHHLGKAWGTLFWRNEQRGKADRRIPGHAKDRWALVQEPETQDRPKLSKRLHRKYYVIV